MNLFMMTPIFAEQHCSKVPISEVPTGEPYYVNNTGMDNTDNLIFTTNFLYQLDGVFLRNNIKHLTISQERFLNKFLKEAAKVNDIMEYNKTLSDTLPNNSNDDTVYKEAELEYPFDYFSPIMRQLDKVLGSVGTSNSIIAADNSDTSTDDSSVYDEYTGTSLVRIFENNLED